MNKSQRNEIRQAAREIFNPPQSNVHYQAMERAWQEKRRENAAKLETAFAAFWVCGMLAAVLLMVFG